MILQKIIDTSDRYDRSIDTIYYYYDPPIILSSPPPIFFGCQGRSDASEQVLRTDWGGEELRTGRSGRQWLVPWNLEE